MSVIIWNIRGLANSTALLYVKNMITTHQSMLVGILEPKQHSSKIGEYAQKICFPKCAHASPVNYHICLFWVQEIDIMVWWRILISALTEAISFSSMTCLGL